MNRFVRLGNVILNLDHVISIRFATDAVAYRSDGTDKPRRRPALWITTTEVSYGEYSTESQIIRFLDDDALLVWDFLRRVLHEIGGVVMHSIDVSPED